MFGAYHFNVLPTTLLRKSFILGNVLFSLLFLSQGAFASSSSILKHPPPFPPTTLVINGNPLSVEIADTNQSREIGLMFRPHLPTNTGMLFVFPLPTQGCFWMKNTLIPLSIAYIDNHGNIVGIFDMQPHDESPVCSRKPFLYALEVNQGWFKKHNVTIGHTVFHLPMTQK